ncbi:MAG: hypothetical protein ACREAA_05685 [Candidatus Polarisedimenticolia bacterium]
MQLLLFELGDVMLALRIEAAGKVMEAGEQAGAGCRVVDAARILESDPGTAAGHIVQLEGSRLVVRLGRLAGMAHVDPRWILPLPGYIFEDPRPPLRGVIGDIQGGGAEAARAAGAYLLDEEALAAMEAEG